MTEAFVLAALIFLMAMLYSSVGHGGASGYLAAMALMSVPAAVMKPSALVLNVLVSTIATIRFGQAGWFSWRVFLPFVVTSIPFAYLGGGMQLDANLHKRIVGVVLIYAAIRLWFGARRFEESHTIKAVPVVLALVCGAALGFLSGLVGVGGGIFLSPLLLLMGWADVKQASAIAAAFILVNSIAGLAGALPSVVTLPTGIYAWGAAAITGGLIGAEMGSRRFASVTLRRVLAVVLVVAAGKLIFA